MTMRFAFACFLLALLAQPSSLHKSDRNGAKPPLEARIEHFDVADAILRDGLSQLSLGKVVGLHLGFEEVIRDRIQDDPRSLSPHFSLHLEGKTVREILDALCKSDPHYTWSEDEGSIKVYPQATKENSAYLFNLRIDRIVVSDIPDPNQGLTPLSKLFPEQQIGYFGSGLGDNRYLEPWTSVFEHLTVRQFINRIAEHMGPQTSWVWEGGRGERGFIFLKGGFNASGGRTDSAGR
jgi:hypothetical protein